MKKNEPFIRGVVPPMITPLTTERKLDTEGCVHMIDRLLHGGVHGIFLLGTTGEGPCIDEAVKKDLIRIAAERIEGKIPLLVGISDAEFTASLKMADFCRTQGVKAVVATPPYYFPLGQAEIVEYFQDLTRELPLPLMIYNMPTMTKSNILAETTRELAAIPGVAGLKDSSCNMIGFHEMLAAVSDRPEFSLLIGPEELLAESVWFGGHGGVPGGANIFPKLYVAQYNAALQGDRQVVIRLQKIILQVRKIYFCGKYVSSMIKGVKCALRILGVCGDTLAEPFHVFGDTQYRQITAILDSIDQEFK